MKLTIYGKKIEKKDGTKFVRYTTTLTRNDSELTFANVKFNDGVVAPKYEACPINVIIEKDKASLSKKRWESGDETGYNYTLWVKEWKEDKGNPFRDSSLDDYI